MQFGDEEQPLDTASGLGGEDVSPLEFTGKPEEVVAIQGPTEIVNSNGDSGGSAWRSPSDQ